MTQKHWDPEIELRVQVPLSDIIDEANPPAHMSADYLNDPLGMGLLMYAPRVYEKIRELKEQKPWQPSK